MKVNQRWLVVVDSDGQVEQREVSAPSVWDAVVAFRQDEDSEEARLLLIRPAEG